MGCVSSKLLATTDLDGEFPVHGKTKRSADPPNHIVSLTSTTYGVLNLDPHEEKSNEEEEVEVEASTVKECKRSPPALLSIPQPMKKVANEEPPEIINAWELMSDLYDEIPLWSPAKMPTKSHSPVHRPEITRSQNNKKKLFAGKENGSPRQNAEGLVPDSNRVLKPFSSLENTQCLRSISAVHQKNTPIEAKIQKSGRNCGLSGSRRSSSPIFDPELLASFERELCEEREQIKKVVEPQPRSRKALDALLLLQSFEEKCPPVGENAVVLYTTTLRGIRKTFVDCNAVRSVIEAYNVQIIERDVSMDSGFREQLRELMGRNGIGIPVVFVKGRLIGGAEEVLKLEEEGKLASLLEGMPRAATWCEGCGGVRFVMCMDCNGSCKVLNEEGKKTVRCGECNENGLIHCPICC